MRVRDTTSSFTHDPVALRAVPGIARWRRKGFTLMEVMIVMALLTILVTSGFRAVLSMKSWARRMADQTAAMAVVEAKIQDIRAATYNPPSANFGSSTVYLTNTGSVALNKAGTTFFVNGDVISKIQPVATGHLITVTGTFKSTGKPFTVTLQTLVNKYSGGTQ